MAISAMNTAALVEFVTGNDDPEITAAIRRCLHQWLTDEGPSLPARLGISRRSAKCELRNAHLRQAAAHITGEPWQRACTLAEAARAFSIRRLPRWPRYGIPDTATDLDLALYRAAAYGEITLSARMIFNILAD